MEKIPSGILKREQVIFPVDMELVQENDDCHDIDLLIQSDLLALNLSYGGITTVLLIPISCCSLTS